jgi:hypothetical protein
VATPSPPKGRKSVLSAFEGHFYTQALIPPAETGLKDFQPGVTEEEIQAVEAA